MEQIFRFEIIDTNSWRLGKPAEVFFTVEGTNERRGELEAMASSLSREHGKNYQLLSSAIR